MVACPVFETKSHVYIVMELVSGGELFDRIVTKDHYSETEAAKVLGPLRVARFRLQVCRSGQSEKWPRTRGQEKQSGNEQWREVSIALVRTPDSRSFERANPRVAGKGQVRCSP